MSALSGAISKGRTERKGKLHQDYKCSHNTGLP